MGPRPDSPLGSFVTGGSGNALPHLPDARTLTALRRAVTTWFTAAKRPLPWRKDYAPYAVWIAEMMLQQTQVDTVLAYHARWMARFPDPAAVAEAGEEAVLKAWEGLGYYRRARNLHMAAGQMVERHQGQVPSSLEHLLALPGIGRYTAGAIRSIGHNLPAPLVDGNVGRVLGRLMALEHAPNSTAGQRYLWALAEALVPRRNPRPFNEGLMELGALVCSPRAPDCPSCPLARMCRAHAEGRAEAYPPPNPRPIRPERTGTLLIIQDGTGKLLLRRRTSKGLWAGLWEPPWYEAGSPPEIRTPLDTRQGRFLGTLRHGLTHMTWVLGVHAVEILGNTRLPDTSLQDIGIPEEGILGLESPDPVAAAWRWADPTEQAALPMSRLGRNALALLHAE